MARRRAINRYPKQYFQLFNTSSEEDVVITLKTYEAAINLRNDLYAFRQVIYRSQDFKELAGKAIRVKLKVVGNKLIAGPIKSKFWEN